MILTVDLGNTTVRLCAVREQDGELQVCRSARLKTERGRSGREYTEAIGAVLAQWRGSAADPSSPDFSETDCFETGCFGAALCSVVPALTAPLRRGLETLLGRPVLEITSRLDTGLILRVPEPERIGADRLADAAWAAAHVPLPAVTVDLGTATTFSVVDEGGAFLGGVIAPGMSVGLRALTESAAQLPAVELKIPERVIGTRTEDCMRAGAVVGTAAMVDGITARIERELGRPVSLVITGGYARYAAPLCAHPHVCDPDVLPKGMALLCRRNASKRKGEAG